MLTRRSEGAVGDQPVEIDLARSANFQVGALKLQPSTLQVQFDGVRKTLEPRVMQVLVALATARGSVVSRDRLIDLCWSGRAVSDDAINRCIAKVRMLGAESGAYQIETVPRVGYRLLESAEPARATARPRTVLRWAVSAALLILVAIAGLFWIWRGSISHAQPVPAIAVAGFTALNTDPDAKPYANSITAAVSESLTNTGATLVPPDRPIATLAEARRAGAALLINGSVRQQGGKVHVTATVESARTGATIVTWDYDFTGAEAASSPDQIGASIATTLWQWIADSRLEPDPEVTEAILHFSNLPDDGSSTRRRLSRDLAEAKPNSALAQLSFTAATAFSLDDIPHDQRPAAVAEARDAARRAAGIRPEFGFILPCWFTPPGREIMTAACDKAMRRAVAADPEPPWASLYFAVSLADAGLLRQAELLSNVSLAQSPYDVGRMWFRMHIVEREYWTHSDAELPALRERIRRYRPAYVNDYGSEVANGNFAAAEALLNDASTRPGIINGGGKDIAIAVFRAAKTRAPADVAEARARCLPPPPAWPPPDKAFGTCLVGFAVLGDLDDVFALAARGLHANMCCSAQSEKAWLQGGGLAYPRIQLWGKAMAPVRADPRFIDLARHAGLLAYWKSGHPPDFCGYERAPVCALLHAA